jgi:L-cysteine S-thiosulfotransferase
MDKSFRAAGLVVFTLLASGCDQQARGFVLPPGDVDKGKASFVDLGCPACHEVQGQFKKLSLEEGGDEVIEVVLGGPVTRVKTYGDLVTSIINPSHRLSRGKNADTMNPDGSSKMPYYNDVMTVQELVDITTFLQGTYQIVMPDYNVMPH